MAEIDHEYVRNEYNATAKKYKAGYEHWRWFSSKSKRRDYEQTFASIQYHLDDYKFKNSLEIGCGTGTWTRLLLERTEKLELIDISENMIGTAKNQFGNRSFKYHVGDFQEYVFPPSTKYDFIMSIRAIEYMKDKQKVINKIYELLGYGGGVLIITKNPHRELRERIPIIKYIKKTPELHRDWIGKDELYSMFKKAGFRAIEIYPVIIQTFILFETRFHIHKSNKIFKRSYKKQFANEHFNLAESYLIKAKKL